MYSIIALLVTILPASVSAGYFYFEPLCAGDRIGFNNTKVHVCSYLSQGYARSLYSVISAPDTFRAGFRPTSGKPDCGAEVCHILYNTPGYCCTASSKNIKGTILYDCSSTCDISDVAAITSIPVNESVPVGRKLMQSESGCVDLLAETTTLYYHK